MGEYNKWDKQKIKQKNAPGHEPSTFFGVPDGQVKRDVSDKRQADRLSTKHKKYEQSFMKEWTHIYTCQVSQCFV